MQKRFSVFIPLFFSLFIVNVLLAQTPVKVSSPDGHISVTVSLQNGKPLYSIAQDSKVFLEESPLGLKTSIGDFSERLTFAGVRTQNISETYELNRAKVSKVEYQANELVAAFTNEAQDTLQVIFRVSDRDVAFSYKLIGKSLNTRVKILSEATAFNLPDQATTFLSAQALPMTG